MLLEKQITFKLLKLFDTIHFRCFWILIKKQIFNARTTEQINIFKQTRVYRSIFKYCKNHLYFLL